MAEYRIVVVGLGYVGLPLASALARSFSVVGFDRDSRRIKEIRSGIDVTREVERHALLESKLLVTDDPQDCSGAEVYIVTVPTPVDAEKKPDLEAVLAATDIVAKSIDPDRRPTIIYESTVYPGVTEEICGPRIEEISGLRRGPDFRLGYSPERVNPGDPSHSIKKIVKVIAGEDPDVVEQMSEIYGAVTSGGVFKAASIKVAEAAKAIENAQRDVNIAFMNEVAQIFSRIEVSVWDVLAAARTKWNFVPFEPGLVGGHCIGVDPYYLSHLAIALGHHPQVILAGRDTNDEMGRWIADALHERREHRTGKALVLGLTFKENVPDLRNSRSFDLVNRLTELGYEVDVSDPLADADELRRDFSLELAPLGEQRYDMVVGAVAHDAYRAWTANELASLLEPGAILADVKGIWRGLSLNADIERWSL